MKNVIFFLIVLYIFTIAGLASANAQEINKAGVCTPEENTCTPLAVVMCVKCGRNSEVCREMATNSVYLTAVTKAGDKRLIKKFTDGCAEMSVMIESYSKDKEDAVICAVLEQVLQQAKASQ